jgi:DNA replication protein DnaC
MNDTPCAKCKGSFIVVRPKGTVAVATLCTCIPDCERCRGTGKVLVTSDGAERIARCKCRMLPDRIAMFNKAGIPARHAHASFESFNKDLGGTMPGFLSTYKWSHGYRPGEPVRGLVLHGEVGRGKTHLLVAMVRQLIMEHGVQVRFVEFSHLLAELKRGFEEGRGQGGLLAHLTEMEILAIDELGKGRNTEWERTIVDELVSQRYNGMKTLLATTNFCPGGPTGLEGNLSLGGAKQSLSDRVGPRVYSRLTEMAEFVDVAGEDFRANDGRGRG